MMHEIFAHLKGSNISGISKNCIGATATFRISIYATTPDSKECVWKVPADAISATIDLPDPSHLQYLTIAAVDAGCYDALLAGAVNLKRLYCDFYPDAVLDLSHCPKLEVLSVQTFAGSSLSKIRLRKEAPLDMQFKIRNEDGEDCRHLIEIEYVQ